MFKLIFISIIHFSFCFFRNRFKFLFSMNWFFKTASLILATVTNTSAVPMSSNFLLFITAVNLQVSSSNILVVLPFVSHREYALTVLSNLSSYFKQKSVFLGIWKCLNKQWERERKEISKIKSAYLKKNLRCCTVDSPLTSFDIYRSNVSFSFIQPWLLYQLLCRFDPENQYQNTFFTNPDFS